MRTGLLFAVAGAIALATSCGGDGADSASATKREFISQADAICHEIVDDAETKVFAYERQNGLRPGTAGVAGDAVEIAEKIAFPAYQEQIDRIGALNPPSEWCGSA